MKSETYKRIMQDVDRESNTYTCVMTVVSDEFLTKWLAHHNLKTLRRLCKTHNLPVTGRRAEIVNLLVFNKNRWMNALHCSITTIGTQFNWR